MLDKVVLGVKCHIRQAQSLCVLGENVTGKSPKCQFMVILLMFPVTFVMTTRTDRTERPNSTYPLNFNEQWKFIHYLDTLKSIQDGE